MNALCWSPLCKKTSLTITFELKCRIMILESRSMFLRSQDMMVPVILTYDLAFVRS